MTVVIEWTVVDDRDFTLVKAETQKEAAIKGLRRGYRPDRTHDVRPRTGDYDLMNQTEFDRFLEEILNTDQ